MPILYIWRRRDHSWLRRYYTASKMISITRICLIVSTLICHYFCLKDFILLYINYVKATLDHRLSFVYSFDAYIFISPSFITTSWLHLNWYFQIWTSTMVTSRCLSYIFLCLDNWCHVSHNPAKLYIWVALTATLTHVLSVQILIFMNLFSFWYSFYLISILDIVSSLSCNYSDHMYGRPDTLNWIASQNHNIYSSNFLCLFHNQLACWWYHL